MTFWFNTYSPRCKDYGSPADQDPPFADGSIRREPDFEQEWPSISALCRGRMFAPRLEVGDSVIYLTKKGRYLGGPSGWHIVAGLRVERRFESHKKAADRHRELSLPLPSNCMVPENPPLPLERTHRGSGNPQDKWDQGYRIRARSHGTFLMCRPLRMDLVNPPHIDKRELNAVFRLGPEEPAINSQTPPTIEESEFHALLHRLPEQLRRR